MSDQIERPNWDEYFLDIAMAVSRRADCTRRQVGVVITLGHRVVATGYNGGPAGGLSCLKGECPRGQKSSEEMPGYTEGNHDYSNCVAIHAEINALLYADRSKIEGGTIWVTHKPCWDCSKAIANSGLTKVVWPGGYAKITARRGGAAYWEIYITGEPPRVELLGGIA